MPVNNSFPIESLAFAEVPNQSKLLIEYQQNPRLLAEYYPNAVNSHTQISKYIPKVLENYKANRGAVCDALEEMNKNFSAGEKTLENINLLRDDDCVAVVSGQQAGLFSGPLYTIYKALSAVKMTECLRGRGIKAVPVFRIATEDHDFEEVSKVFLINKTESLKELKNEPKRCYTNLPVGYVKLNDSIRETIDELFHELPETEFTGELKSLIDEIWVSGKYFSDAFALLLTKLFDKYGLIMLCPLNEKLKKIAAPIYVEAIKKSDEIVKALIERSADLIGKGYPAQVLVTEDYLPLFWQAKDNTRNALKKSKEGTFKPKTNRANLRSNSLPKLLIVNRRDFRRASFCVRSFRIIFCRRFAISAARRKSLILLKAAKYIEF